MRANPADPDPHMQCCLMTVHPGQKVAHASIRQAGNMAFYLNIYYWFLTSHYVSKIQSSYLGNIVSCPIIYKHLVRLVQISANPTITEEGVL